MNAIVAFPSTAPGGLDSALGQHFGHCDLYTLVTVENSEVKDVSVIPNVPHEQGGCMAPVQYLVQNKVNALVAGGMGMRPLMGFNQMGIKVFFGGMVPTVGEGIKAFLEERLPEFGQEHSCGGGGGGMMHQGMSR